MSPAPDKTVGVNAPATQSLIVGLLRAFMGLEVNQCVVYNQKWVLPNDSRLYVVVGSLSQKPYGTSAETREVVADDETTKLVEDVSIASREVLTIDLLSRSQEAVNRKEEPLMAFSSYAAQALAETYSLKMPRIPTGPNDVSRVEGTAKINRFQYVVPVLRTRTRSADVPFFDRFTQPSLVIEP